MQHDLARIPLFQTIPPKRLQEIGTIAELRRFRKGETIFKESQPAERVWLIQHGWVHLAKYTPQGTQVTIFTVTPGEMLCGFSAVLGYGTYYASAVAATDTTALGIPREAFSRLLQEQPGFAESILTIYHTRMRNMAEAISLGQAPVEQRLAYTLLRLRSSFGNVVPVTHHELARMAGTRWETSIRTLSVMKRRKWITTSRGKMTVVAPQKLRALLTRQKTPCLGRGRRAESPEG